MIDSPVLQELKEEWTREVTVRVLMTVLVGRFGAPAQALRAEIETIRDATRLEALVGQAATCGNLEAFHKTLSS
jgi:hypothetical protein